MSCLTTSATRRSRRVPAAVLIASVAASSHDVPLVPMISVTLYTLIALSFDCFLIVLRPAATHRRSTSAAHLARITTAAPFDRPEPGTQHGRRPGIVAPAAQRRRSSRSLSPLGAVLVMTPDPVLRFARRFVTPLRDQVKELVRDVDRVDATGMGRKRVEDLARVGPSEDYEPSRSSNSGCAEP